MRTGRSRSWALIIMAALTLVACADSRSRAASGAAATTLPSEVYGGGAGEVPNWDEPLADGVPVPSEAAAAELLPFSPIVPEGISPPPIIVVTDPAGTPESDRVMALIYTHLGHGRFWIIESVSQATEAKFQSIVDNCADPTSGCASKASLVEIRDGITALLLEGPVTTALQWQDEGVTFDILGPFETFTAEEAMSLANEV